MRKTLFASAAQLGIAPVVSACAQAMTAEQYLMRHHTPRAIATETGAGAEEMLRRETAANPL